jgi:type III pantothenate kinase
MKILGDIGNTETKICLINSKNKIVKKINFKTGSITLSALKNNFSKFNIKKNEITKCLFCSVVPKVFKLVKLFLIKRYNIKCHELKNLKLSSMLKIKVNYNQIGSDRLANAIGLMNNKDNYIILDFGTATTFDVLIKNTYYGGVIAPGVKLSLNTLIEKATLIPKMNLIRVKKVIGANTISAVRSGFFWGYSGLIDNIVNLIKKETRKSFKIIITGGFSELFKKSFKKKVTHNKDITINGLIKASKLIN